MENTLLSVTEPIVALANIQEVEKIVIPRILDLQKRAALQQRYNQTAAALKKQINTPSMPISG